MESTRLIAPDRTARVARAIAALACAALLLSPAAFADGLAPPCDDCKFKPCVENELNQARAMQAMYRDQAAKAKTAEEYEKTVNEKGGEILKQYGEMRNALPQCGTKFPDPNDTIAMRKWQLLGWGYEALPGGKATFSWSATTNVENCTLRQDQIDKTKEIVACLDIALGTEAHETDHVNRCKVKKPGTPAERASYEVQGYAQEIKALQGAMTRLNKRCKPPRRGSFDDDPAVKEQKKKSIEASTNRVNMYLKKGGK